MEGQNIYVGARYVPTPEGEWDINKEYDSLSIVSYNSSSYTSRQPVPKGIQITDKNYWLETANYNAQLENIKNNLISQMNVIQSEMDNINDEFSAQKKIRMVLIGDSYGYRPNSWQQRLQQMYVLSNNDCFRFSEGSTGFEHQGLNGHNFKELLIANINKITDRNSISHVIVCGGTNDIAYFTNSLNLNNSIKDFIVYAKSAFPNAKIYIAFIGNLALKTPEQLLTYEKVLYAYIANTTINGAIPISGARKIMHVPFCREDNQHPNEEGSLRIAIQLKTEIDGGTTAFLPNLAAVNRTFTIIPNTDEITDLQLSSNMTYIESDNEISIRYTKFAVRLKQEKSIINFYCDFGTINCLSFGMPAQELTTTFPGFIMESDGTKHDATIQLIYVPIVDSSNKYATNAYVRVYVFPNELSLNVNINRFGTYGYNTVNIPIDLF